LARQPGLPPHIADAGGQLSGSACAQVRAQDGGPRPCRHVRVSSGKWHVLTMARALMSTAQRIAKVHRDARPTRQQYVAQGHRWRHPNKP